MASGRQLSGSHLSQLKLKITHLQCLGFCAYLHLSCTHRFLLTPEKILTISVVILEERKIRPCVYPIKTIFILEPVAPEMVEIVITGLGADFWKNNIFSKVYQSLEHRWDRLPMIVCMKVQQQGSSTRLSTWKLFIIIWTRFLTVWISWGSQIFTDSFSSLQAVDWNSLRSLLIDACKHHSGPGSIIPQEHLDASQKWPRATSLFVIPVIGLSSKWMCSLNYPFPFGGSSCS